MAGIDLLSEIASVPRLEILKLLSQKEQKANQIAKALKSSIQATSRHLDRLVESKLIEKTNNGKYQVSTIGTVTLQQVPFFEFLERHKKYFQTHDFTGIPDHLISRIGELKGCRLEEDFMKSIQMARDHCSNAKRFLYGVSFSSPVDLYDIVLNNLKKGLEFNMTYGTNSIFSKGFSEYSARRECRNFNSKKFQEWVVKVVPFSVGISEKHCHFLFANKELGYIDGQGVFFGGDKKSIRWCRDLIEYYWKMPKVQNFKLIEQ